MGIDRCDGGYGVSVVQHLAAGQHVGAFVLKRNTFLLAAPSDDVGGFREIVGGDNRVDAVEQFGLANVNISDPSMGVRTPNNRPVELTGLADVRAIAGCARHLVNAIVTDRTRSDDAVLLRVMLNCDGVFASLDRHG